MVAVQLEVHLVGHKDLMGVMELITQVVVEVELHNQDLMVYLITQ